jgi:valyl-tRNA synthetase
VIEPLLKKQWFLRCEDMASRAIQVTQAHTIVTGGIMVTTALCNTGRVF